MATTLCDVGPRDGLQNESQTLEPAVRAELVNLLAAAGLPRVEAASFVRADRVPQMAGAEEVAAGIQRRDGTEYSGLVLNAKGYERFAATGLDRSPMPASVLFSPIYRANRPLTTIRTCEAGSRASATRQIARP